MQKIKPTPKPPKCSFSTSPFVLRVILRLKRPPSVKPSAEMSFRSARDVPLKGWVIETGDLCHERGFMGFPEND